MTEATGKTIVYHWLKLYCSYKTRTFTVLYGFFFLGETRPKAWAYYTIINQSIVQVIRRH